MYSTPVIFDGFFKKEAEFGGGRYPISAECQLGHSMSSDFKKWPFSTSPTQISIIFGIFGDLYELIPKM